MAHELPIHKPRSRANLRVGDLAKRVGKTVRALRLYEELGLLVPAERSPGGFRLYTRESELRVRWIGKLQDMGFSLQDIKEIVQSAEASGSAPGTMQRVRELYREKLEETRAQRQRLETLERELQASLEYLDTCDTCDPKRLLEACTVCDQHDCDHHAPELVAGLHAH